MIEVILVCSLCSLWFKCFYGARTERLSFRQIT